MKLKTLLNSACDEINIVRYRSIVLADVSDDLNRITEGKIK